MHMCTCPGVPCDVQSVAATEITCITGPSPPDSEYYPGNNIKCYCAYTYQNFTVFGTVGTFNVKVISSSWLIFFYI